mmetsp:Transcript_3417/g.6257  ORF Transcript_3417/g.6257 Transcript_3417/m.6257 type:complete len:151 (+) Transcript_3417:636-1088(+)
MKKRQERDYDYCCNASQIIFYHDSAKSTSFCKKRSTSNTSHHNTKYQLQNMATRHDIGDQGLHYDNDLLMTSISIEDPLCNYLSAFDGTKKEFNDIQPYFDNLYSENFIHLMDGNPIDKQTYACIIKQLLEKRIVATLEDIYFVDDTHVE